MNSLVVYHSQFGNTKALAEIISAVLKSYGPASIADVDELGPNACDGIDLLVVGGPTQAHGASPAMKAFLDTLQNRPVRRLPVAVFDTRLKGPEFLWGSAAKSTAELLERDGFELVAPPESFLVRGMKEPHLVEGEYDHAKSWAAELARQVEWVQTAATLTAP